jgi:hypothetical protein
MTKKRGPIDALIIALVWMRRKAQRGGSEAFSEGHTSWVGSDRHCSGRVLTERPRPGMRVGLLPANNQPWRVLERPPGTGHSLLVVVLGFRNWQSVRLHRKRLRTADRRH